jgi:hypothetical protein
MPIHLLLRMFDAIAAVAVADAVAIADAVLMGSSMLGNAVS